VLVISKNMYRKLPKMATEVVHRREDYQEAIPET